MDSILLFGSRYKINKIIFDRNFFHYTRGFKPKRVRVCGAHFRAIAPGQRSSVRRNIAAVSSQKK